MIFIAFNKRDLPQFDGSANFKMEFSNWFPGLLLLTKTLHPVSRMLSALEMNLTSLFCIITGSGFPEAVIFEKIHDPLAPVYTEVKPAFLVILHLQDPSLQCFPLSHNRNAPVTGCRTSQHQLFQIHPYLRR